MLTLIAVIVGALLAGVAIAVIVRRRSASNQRVIIRRGAFVALAERVLPNAPVASGSSGGSVLEPAAGLRRVRSGGRRPKGSNDLLEMGAILGGAEALTAQSWMSTDPHVFDAFGQLSHEQIHGFWDLEQVVDANHYNVASAAFQRAMGGHVAEFHVADHLHSAGLDVVMPHAANQAGLEGLSE